MHIPLVRPTFPRLEDFDLEFDSRLASGNVTNNYTAVLEFEARLSAYLGVPTLAFCNGQTALMAALMAVGVRECDNVICPSFTFPGTVHAIAMLGARPLFVDINEETFTLDCELITELDVLTSQAIVGVDVYGICADREGICDVFDFGERRIDVVFDSAPAFGSVSNGKLTAQCGSGHIFSFHATKPFSTMEGGALCSPSREVIELAKCIRNFGQDDDKNCVSVGLNGKMMEVSALIGIEQIRTWEEVSERRRNKGHDLRMMLKAIPGVRVAEFGFRNQRPIWTYMPVLVDDRERVMQHLKERGIETRKYYPACHKLFPYDTGAKLPVTEHVAERVIALPVHHDMTPEEMAYICETVEGAVK